eukprot:GEMP01032844.1.p1 GENE.GEMP01032844.1~~GEMP01032844.1.p1  ORF type:complete len:122 (-),score=6.09 GEMP01032844.1:141-506(-)
MYKHSASLSNNIGSSGLLAVHVFLSRFLRLYRHSQYSVFVYHDLAAALLVEPARRLEKPTLCCKYLLIYHILFVEYITMPLMINCARPSFFSYYCPVRFDFGFSSAILPSTFFASRFRHDF